MKKKKERKLKKKKMENTLFYEQLKLNNLDAESGQDTDRN
jgi:hypothetical protein